MREVYIHDKNKKYPNKDYTHMVVGKHAHDYVYDKDFMYRVRGKYAFLRFLLKILMIIFVQPVCAIRYCLRIKGKKNIRLYKKLTKKKEMITICNHTTEWDTIFVMISRYFRFPEFPAWQEGCESTAGMMYRVAGGIPMPIHSSHGVIYAYNAMRDVLQEGKWLHVFPEAACWPFYPAIRPFQRGTFKLAFEMNLPILPMAVTYRAPKGIYKLFKKHPNATLNIGEPVFIDKSLEKNEAIEDLSKRCHLAMVKLIGLDSEEENQELINSIPTYEVN